MSEACGIRGEVVTAYEILEERPKGKRHLIDAGVHPWIILKYILNKCGESCGLDSTAQGGAQ
jgi:hypothetical protein